jgi:hypothetical protein
MEYQAKSESHQVIFDNEQEAQDYVVEMCNFEVLVYEGTFIVKNEFEEYFFDNEQEAQERKNALNNTIWAITQIEKPAQVLPLNWHGLEDALWKDPLMFKVMTEANPNAWALMLKVFTDGKLGTAIESSLLYAISILGVEFTIGEKDYLNQLFNDFNFTIKL